MRKLEINYDMPVPSIADLNHPLVERIYELVNQWNANADNHFTMASAIGGGSFSDDSKETMLLEFLNADIADAIDAKEDYDWKNHDGGYLPDVWACGRSGSHVWLHLNHERLLMVSCHDQGQEVKYSNPTMGDVVRVRQNGSTFGIGRVGGWTVGDKPTVRVKIRGYWGQFDLSDVEPIDNP